MARAGHITCPLCGTAEIAVTRTGAGTLNLKCHKCEFTGYGKPGTRAARLIAGQMTVDTEDTEKPAEPPAKAREMPPPVDVPLKEKTQPRRVVSSAFDLAQLG